MLKYLRVYFTLIFASSSQAALAEPSVVVKGLFKGAAVLEIDGRREFMKVGTQSDEGVILVSASSKQATIEIEGKRKTLSLSQSIGTTYREASKDEVRFSSQHQGHYFGSGKFNGRSTQFLVDTGASTVAMSSSTAERLGIRYKKGQIVKVDTAQGTTRGYKITLSRVEVGSIRVNNVETIVLEGEYPLDVLLGNSFLAQTDMHIQNGVLVLKSKY